MERNTNWGACRDFDARYAVAPGDLEIEDRDNWEESDLWTCWVCGGTVEWLGSDPEGTVRM